MINTPFLKFIQAFSSEFVFAFESFFDDKNKICHIALTLHKQRPYQEQYLLHTNSFYVSQGNQLFFDSYLVYCINI